ncbi:MAG: hypothetical protein R6V07_00005, partial [Armatimonadota bacterium]
MMSASSFASADIRGRADVSGFPSPEISVEVKEEELLRYDLTIDEIISAIQTNNQDISGGQIKS